MTSPLAKLALRRLADARPDVEPPTPSEAEGAIAAIARELEATRARRRKRIGALAILSLAAAALLAIGASGLRSPAGAVAEDISGSVLVVRGDRGTTLARGGTIGKGDRVVASARGSASLRLAKGTELRALDGADVLVAENGKDEVFELRAGSIELHVAKLGTGERFIVRTADSEVEVRGTRFRVDVGEPCAGTTTRVGVTEGVVVVRHGGAEARVTANESWPPGCATSTKLASPLPTVAPTAPTAPMAVVEPASPPVVSPMRSVATPSKPAVAPAPPPMSSSDLAEQNRLYAEAMAAKRRGDTPSAVRALDRLSAAYPHGPLAESASVERMRLLASSDPSRAADAARAYLARHPKGYAREEARRLAGAP